MKLINFYHNYDFGYDWYAQFINIRGISLLQVSISWEDCPSWPYCQIKSGNGNLFDVLFFAHKFGFDLTILGKTWKLEETPEVIAALNQLNHRVKIANLKSDDDKFNYDTGGK